MIKPTLEELEDKFRGRVQNPRQEAEKFYNYYESVGWKVGKKPMVSWPHAVGGWIQRSAQYGQSGAVSRSEAADQAVRDYLSQF